MNDSQLRTNLRAELLERAARIPSGTRRTESRKASALLMLAIATALATFAWSGGIDPAGRPIPMMLATSLGTAALAATGLRIALHRGRSMLGRSSEELLLVPLLLVCAALLWKTFWGAPGSYRLEGSAGAAAARCLGLGVLIGAPPLAAMLVARRGTDPLHPGAWGANMGAVAGLCAAVLLDLSCPAGSSTHLVLGHLAPFPVLSLAGFGIGRSVLGPRFTKSAAQLGEVSRDDIR
jgi:hypothetical protein